MAPILNRKCSLRLITDYKLISKWKRLFVQFYSLDLQFMITIILDSLFSSITRVFMILAQKTRCNVVHTKLATQSISSWKEITLTMHSFHSITKIIFLKNRRFGQWFTGKSRQWRFWILYHNKNVKRWSKRRVCCNVKF